MANMLYMKSIHTILQDGKLFQQYIVDGWASTEQSRLTWVKRNQSTLQADLYQGIQDVVAERDINFYQTGQWIILPATHTGSPRHMHQLF